MPNAQQINQTLPSFSATKTSASLPDLKTNNKNFNQVLKSEVANKIKKVHIEPLKNNGIQNAKSNTSPKDTSKTVIDEEKTECQDTNKHDISDQEEQVPSNLSDLGSLLAFVNQVSALAQTTSEDFTDSTANVTATVIEQATNLATSLTTNSVPLSPPVNDNGNIIDTKEFTETTETDQVEREVDTLDHANKAMQKNSSDQQAGLLSTQKNLELNEFQANTATSTTKADVAARFDTRDSLAVTHQLTTKDLANTAPATVTTMGLVDTAPRQVTALELAKTNTHQVNSMDLANSAHITERIAPAELPKAPPLNSTPAKLEISTSADITDSKDSKVSHQTIEIGRDSQSLPITITNGSEEFSKELNAQLIQEKQDILKSMKSESQNEMSISANKADFSVTAPAVPAPPTVLGNTTISEHISPRVGAKGWDQAIGQKIVWMVAGGEQSAQLTLNPPELGPVQVVLSISDNFVDASFVSSHLDVREAIEAAAPKLREMMDNAGISLSGFSVSAESAQSGNPFNSEKFQHNGNSSLRGTDTRSDNDTQSLKLSTPTQNNNREQGLVDTFA